jgi:hypothetical protein
MLRDIAFYCAHIVLYCAHRLSRNEQGPSHAKANRRKGVCGLAGGLGGQDGTMSVHMWNRRDHPRVYGDGHADEAAAIP